MKLELLGVTSTYKYKGGKKSENNKKDMYKINPLRGTQSKFLVDFFNNLLVIKLWILRVQGKSVYSFSDNGLGLYFVTYVCFPSF